MKPKAELFGPMADLGGRCDAGGSSLVHVVLSFLDYRSGDAFYFFLWLFTLDGDQGLCIAL